MLNLLPVCYHKLIVYCNVHQKNSNFLTWNLKHGHLFSMSCWVSHRKRVGHAGEKRVLVGDLKLLLHRSSWATVRACDSLEVRGAATGNQKQNLPLLPHPELEPWAGVPWQITLCSPVSEARALLKAEVSSSSKHNGIINSLSSMFFKLLLHRTRIALEGPVLLNPHFYILC